MSLLGASGRGVVIVNNSSQPQPSSWRTSAPQILASMAQSMLLLSLGMFISIPTMVIGSLHNSKTGLSMTDGQASWFAGLIFINQPVGSLLSGFVQDGLGRKKSTLLVNLPQIAAWVLLYSAQSVTTLYIAAMMMGFSVGFLEAPSFSYVGEICQPHLRGRLASCTALFVVSGTLLVYLMGAVTDWRTLSAISTCVPIFTILAVLQIPESPVWLVMKGKDEEAKKALAWLRGWVSVQDVAQEFEDMKQHIVAKRRNLLPTQNGNDYKPVLSDETGEAQAESPKPLNWKTSIFSLMEPDMWRPLRLIVVFFFFFHCAAFNGSRPYLVLIFKRLHTDLDPFVGPVLAVLSLLLGTIICIICVRRLGKRLLSLISMSLSTTVLFTMGLYAYFHTHHDVTIPYFPIILFCCLYFCNNLGIGVVPWVLLSEVFPPRGKGLGGGISAALYYLGFFLTTKTFIDLENLLGLSGICFFYAFFGVAGIVFVFFCLPETEGKTLAEVENLFNDREAQTSGGPESC